MGKGYIPIKFLKNFLRRNKEEIGGGGSESRDIIKNKLLKVQRRNLKLNSLIKVKIFLIALSSCWSGMNGWKWMVFRFKKRAFVVTKRNNLLKLFIFVIKEKVTSLYIYFSLFFLFFFCYFLLIFFMQFLIFLFILIFFSLYLFFYLFNCNL